MRLGRRDPPRSRAIERRAPAAARPPRPGASTRSAAPHPPPIHAPGPGAPTRRAAWVARIIIPTPAMTAPGTRAGTDGHRNERNWERGTRRSTRARRPRRQRTAPPGSESSSHNVRTAPQAGSTQTSSSSPAPGGASTSRCERAPSRCFATGASWTPGTPSSANPARRPRPGCTRSTSEYDSPAPTTSSEPGHSSSQHSRPCCTTSTAAPAKSRSTAAGEPACSTHSAAHDRTVASGSTTAPSTYSRPTPPKAHQSKSASPASTRHLPEATRAPSRPRQNEAP